MVVFKGKRVAVADFVTPSTQNTVWGLGGTCVNVGCIPKKLFHLSALFAESMDDAGGLGWDVKAKHDWSQLQENVTSYIQGLNFGYKVQLREENVKYYNAYARFVDKDTVELLDGIVSIVFFHAHSVLCVR